MAAVAASGGGGGGGGGGGCLLRSASGQEPSALAARAQQMDGLECDIEERERKFRKYGSW